MDTPEVNNAKSQEKTNLKISSRMIDLVSWNLGPGDLRFAGAAPQTVARPAGFEPATYGLEVRSWKVQNR